MIFFNRCGLAIAALAILGCGQDRSVDVAPVSPAATASKPAADQPAAGDKDLSAEQILDGSRTDPFADSRAKAVVLIFVSTACPVANRYAPEMGRLYHAYRTKGVTFWLIYGDSDETPQQIHRHLEEYSHQIPALRDPDHRLVTFCEVTRTPEAVVFGPGRQRKYRGRIDDRFTDYGKSREFASQHDLQDAIEAVLAGKGVAAPVTPVVGCPIPGTDQ